MHSPFYFLKYFSRNPNCITRSLYFGYGKVSQVAKMGEIMLLFTGRHFWNRKCRKKTWWQQEFAVFKCEATANSVTGHVCVYSNDISVNPTRLSMPPSHNPKYIFWLVFRLCITNFNTFTPSTPSQSATLHRVLPL